MKYHWLFVIIVLSLGCCASTESKKALSLREAIEQSAEKTAHDLPAGSRVAIVAFDSENAILSEYIMEELTGALFDRGVMVADRQNLAHVYKELDFQITGDVSDESAMSIGKFLGADIVVTGQLASFGDLYRFRISALNVETAAHVSITRLDVRSDPNLKRMIGVGQR